MPTPRKTTETKRLAAGQAERPMIGSPVRAVHLQPPDKIRPAAREYFTFLAARLAELRTSRLADALVVNETANCMADLDSLRAELAALGSTAYKCGDLWKSYPQAAQLADCSRRVRALLAELGMTPASAARAEAA